MKNKDREILKIDELDIQFPIFGGVFQKIISTVLNRAWCGTNSNYDSVHKIATFGRKRHVLHPEPATGLGFY